MKFVEHRYPKQIKLFDDAFLSHQCAVASSQGCVQPFLNQTIKTIFRQICINIINCEWPLSDSKLPTRMTEIHDRMTLDTKLLSLSQKAVCVDIARAGMLPSQVFLDVLFEGIGPQGIRQDHIFASRVTDETGRVTHTHLSGSKIGGDVDHSIVMIPDPMGATGHSMCEVISHYKEKVEGTARKYIAAHMIVTPEYIKKITDIHPDVIVYAARLDRGFSSEKALAEIPGTFWDEEKGLDDNQYIVPGAGGVGELINNAFV